MQAMYAPAVNYNTEFPQLGAPHRVQMPMEPPPRTIPQHVRGPWVASTSTMGYGHLDTMMGRSIQITWVHLLHLPCICILHSLLALVPQ
jgi:hypothetical protein